MKTQKFSVLTVFGFGGLLCLFLLVAKSNSQTTASGQWGSASNGLQMSIAATKSDKVDSPSFQVAFQNVGEQDVLLSLGMMLANGKVQLPDRIRLVLTDTTGQKRELYFSDKRYPGVRGRVDEYRVPLRAGSTYSLNLKLDQFWSPSTKEFVLNLKPGKYQVSAQFDGVGEKPRNWGQKDIGLMNYWKGKVQSNVLSFER